MTVELLAALLLFAFVSSVTPGPNNLMLLSSGANFGFVRTIPHMLGIAIGFVVMACMAGFGLVQLFTTYPFTYIILKSLSVAYLLFLAWKIAFAVPPSDEPSVGGKPLTFLQAALFQWVNPKAVAMAVTAMSVYMPAQRTAANAVLVATVFGLVNLPSVSIWTLLGTQLKRLLSDQFKLRVFNFSVAFLLLGSIYPILFMQ